MQVWSQFPLARYALWLIVGIYSNNFFQLSTKNTYLISLALLVAVFACFTSIYTKYARLATHTGGFIIGIIGLIMGNFLAFNNQKLNNEAHYKHSYENAIGWRGRIADAGSEKDNYFLFEANVEKLFFNDSVSTVTGNVNLYVKKDSSFQMLRYGDVIWVKDRPFPIPPPGNPNEFNYSAYMALHHIHDQQFIDTKQLKLLNHNPRFEILALGYDIRAFFQQKIDQHIQGRQEAAVLSALLLGNKDYLDDRITYAFASAGAMHVLAVSGLHVGIIFLVLNLIFKPLHKVPQGKYIVLALHLVGLWSYAMITGFSPSVLRAVTMFSLVAIANAVSRQSNIYNTIAISAIILLLIEPNFIYYVGFQLSYLAVLGIIFLQPRLYNLWIPKNWLVDKAWQITAVSLAAQLATFPLGLYYFHQFPTYFIVSNLVVIPFITVFLQMGLLFLFTSAISDTIGEAIAFLLEHGLWGLNVFVQWIESLPISLLDWIYVSNSELFLIYGLILAFIGLLYYRNLEWSIPIAALSILFFITQWQRLYKQKEETKIIHYAARNSFAIDFIDKFSATLVTDSVYEKGALPAFQIDPYRLASNLPSTSIQNHNTKVYTKALTPGITAYYWKGFRIIRITDLSKLKLLNPIKCDHLIIGNNALKSPDQLKNLEYRHLIFDETNRLSPALFELAATLPDARILARDGAFIEAH